MPRARYEVEVTLNDRISQDFSRLTTRLRNRIRDQLLPSNIIANTARLSAGLGALGGAYLLATRQAANFGAEISRQAGEISLNADAFQVYAQLAQDANQRTEVITTSFRQLGVAIGDARNNSLEKIRAFQQLGVAYEDVDGNARDVNDVFRDIVDVLETYNGEAETLSALQRVIGEGAAKLPGVFKEGSDGIDEQAEKLRKLGIIMKNDVVKRLDTMNTAFGRFATTLKVQLATFLASNEKSGFLEFLEKAQKGITGLVRDGDLAGFAGGFHSGTVEEMQKALEEARKELKEKQDSFFGTGVGTTATLGLLTGSVVTSAYLDAKRVAALGRADDRLRGVAGGKEKSEPGMFGREVHENAKERFGAELKYGGLLKALRAGGAVGTALSAFLTGKEYVEITELEAKIEGLERNIKLARERAKQDKIAGQSSKPKAELKDAATQTPGSASVDFFAARDSMENNLEELARIRKEKQDEELADLIEHKRKLKEIEDKALADKRENLERAADLAQSTAFITRDIARISQLTGKEQAKDNKNLLIAAATLEGSVVIMRALSAETSKGWQYGLAVAAAATGVVANIISTMKGVDPTGGSGSIPSVAGGGVPEPANNEQNINVHVVGGALGQTEADLERQGLTLADEIRRGVRLV